jgi:hypothetical protein
MLFIVTEIGYQRDLGTGIDGVGSIARSATSPTMTYPQRTIESVAPPRHCRSLRARDENDRVAKVIERIRTDASASPGRSR